MSKASEKAFVSAIAYAGNQIGKLISMCSLEPAKGWRVWTDNAGHELTLLPERKARISKSKIVNFKTYDLYHKSTPKLILANSKWVLLARAIYKNSDCMFIWAVGKDDKIRLLSFIDNVCKNKSPLSSGLETLLYVINNMEDSELVQVSTSEISPPIKCNVLEAYSTVWPPEDDSEGFEKILTNLIS